ncbi:MAG TPA: sugar ABC transporter ATP-binding protein [Anaeromyxobacter sp.]|nr:sugar ABC transporter ATP-binding protein [Anaeromyxobacter sp.]
MSDAAVPSPPAAEAPAPLLSMAGISKSFSGVEVLRDATFDLRPGEVHVLAGENGAGKSTLIKIAAGVHTEYEGSIHLYGQLTRFDSPHDANRQGISVIHQEMSLIDSMSVVDNMFLGRELTRGGTATQWLDRAAQRRRAREFCDQLGLGDIDLDRPVEDFSLSVKNRIEIAKALAWNARILVMDEPTSALSEPEVVRLFDLIAQLKRRGCGIVYISHRMEEIYRVADRITVLRDGRYVGTELADRLPQAELIRWMIGRELKTHFPERKAALGEERLRVEGLSVVAPGATSTGSRRWLVRDVSLAVRAGEIVGVAGLQGSGNSELFRGIFGASGDLATGRVYLEGRRFHVRSPRHSVEQGMAYLTSDRKGTGLVLGLDLARNVTLASVPAVSPGGWVQERRERQIAAHHTRALRIRATGPTQEVSTLSGGNQQKVALAKWIETRPRVLLLDEPTRGVDVGAKHEIYELMNQWTQQGHAILLITSEMPELLGLSDRIVAMHRGRVTGEFTRSEATQEKVLQAAMAVSTP